MEFSKATTTMDFLEAFSSNTPKVNLPSVQETSKKPLEMIEKRFWQIHITQS